MNKLLLLLPPAMVDLLFIKLLIFTRFMYCRFQKMKNLLLEENLKYLKKLNISSQPHTSDFN